MFHLFVSISTGFSNACIVKCDNHFWKCMNVRGSPLSGIVIDLKGNLALGRIWLKHKCFKCNFICSQVLWKSLHWNLFCSSPLFHFPARKLLFGSILGVISVSFSLFPPVNAMPSKNGFTPHVLRDGGCFHFYPLLHGKNSATDILRTDECDWGWLVAKSEAMSERTERDAWNGLVVQWKSPSWLLSECVSGSCRCYERLP